MKHLLLYSLAALLLFGCSKSDKPEGLKANELMTFSSASPSSTTRSTFSGDGGSLVWSDYDNIGAYSFSGSTLLYSGFCTISDIDGADARFQSSAARKSWAGSASGTLTFYAYYPELGSSAGACSGGVVSLSVAKEQSEEFGKYQICVSEGFEISEENLVNGAEVELQFSPATSMIRVRPTLTAASSEESVDIIQLVLSIEDVKLAGDCELDLANGLLGFSSGSSSSTITVNLSTPVTIGKTAADNSFIPAVILPASASGKKVSFYVLTDKGVKLTMADKSAPAQFKAGLRYNLERDIIVTASDTPDAIYEDGGLGWADGDVVDDGAYTSEGNAW